MRAPTLDQLNRLIDETLGLEGRGQSFDCATPLLGGLPEFDSMAVVSLVTALEERFGVRVQDEDITAETFATVGSLLAVLEQRAAA